MTRTPTLILAVLLTVTTAAAVAAQTATEPPPPPPPQPTVELPPELARVLTDYEKAWSSRDAAALARLFAEDGYVLPHGHPPAKGRAAIEQFYQGHGGPLALRAFAWATADHVGYILGAYATTPEEPDHGKFTLTLRQDPTGHWLIVSDMDNPNQRR